MDLSTTYLGLRLANPIVHSPSPLTRHPDNLRRLEDAGIGAIVLHSLFEEADGGSVDPYLIERRDRGEEAAEYFPERGADDGPDEYFERIAAAKRAVAVPLVGSLNGVSPGGWIEHARGIEQAGADALELNVYYLPADPGMSGHEVEQMHLDVVRAVRKAVALPLAVKVGPFFSNIAHTAQRLAACGADGLVLFNRFYQPDLDLDAMEPLPRLRLSDSGDLLLPLRWTAILHGRVPADLAISGGVHDHLDVLKCVAAGASVAMMTSELLRYGIPRVSDVLRDARHWLERRGHASLDALRGRLSQRLVAEPAAFERACYIRTLRSWPREPSPPPRDREEPPS